MSGREMFAIDGVKLPSNASKGKSGTRAEFQKQLVKLEAAAATMLTDTSVLKVDAGNHSEQNLKALETQGIDALIADNQMRGRDARFATQSRHQQDSDPLHDKSPMQSKAVLFEPSDFTYDPDNRTCVCPAGQVLQRSGTHQDDKGYIGDRFRGSEAVCQKCPLRTQCLRHPDKSAGRQVTFFKGKAPGTSESASARMKHKIDSPEGRRRYGRRFAVVEPVFANRRHNKRLYRFTLRGRRKVDAQWKLYCLVHNIEKLINYGNMQCKQCP